jgi:hypothetical protein
VHGSALLQSLPTRRRGADLIWCAACFDGLVRIFAIGVTDGTNAYSCLRVLEAAAACTHHECSTGTACHALMYSRAEFARAWLAACVNTLCFACACACVHAARLQADCV